MFISDRVVFIDLPKTGSSHVRRLLSRLEGGRERGVHVRAGRALRQSRRHFWGTIRNPWDWYVSLWAYGCDGRGTLHDALTSDLGWLRSRGWKHAPFTAARALASNPRRHRDAWREAYADVDSPQAFRRWLGMIHDPAFSEDLGDAYRASGLAGFAGLLSFRYLRLYCAGELRGLSRSSELAAFDVTHCYITRFLRTDRLADDLVAAFAAMGTPLAADQEATIRQARRSNPSSRRRDTAWFYDDDSLELVRRRDRLIIDKFGFTPPGD